MWSATEWHGGDMRYYSTLRRKLTHKKNPQILGEDMKWNFEFEKNKENAPRDGSGKPNWV